MPQTLTTSQITALKNSITDPASAAAAYSTLYNAGYNYASWSKGVATGDTVSGQAALSYLQSSASAGVNGYSPRNLTQADIDKIRVDMARETFSKYENLAKENGDTLSRDLNYSEVRDIHNTVFYENGLSLDNWTLNTPMELVRQKYGDQAVEKLWTQIRETGGDGPDALLVNTILTDFVAGATQSNDPAAREVANRWFDVLANIPTAYNITVGWVSENAKESADWISKNATEFWKTISDIVSTLPDPLVKTIVYVDPLILDLDANGLEITPLARGVLFDADADTIRTGTAWASANDGILVRDLNGNGLIDSGRELFGDETILADGKKASHGFAALTALDQGSVVNGVTVGAGDGPRGAVFPQTHWLLIELNIEPTDNGSKQSKMDKESHKRSMTGPPATMPTSAAMSRRRACASSATN